MQAHTDHSNIKLGGHVPALDGVRGLAILLVMFHHLTLIGHGSASVLDRAVGAAANLGWVGVDVFFVLSGFLITGILFDSKGSEHYFRNFYARRVLRIFPLYYAFLTFFFLVLPHLAALRPVLGGDPRYTTWPYWLYLSNFSAGLNQEISRSLIVTWSLAIEEQFYILWPAVIFLASRRTAMRICVGLVAVSVVCRVLGLVSHTPWKVDYFTPMHLDGLAIGALLALAIRAPGGVGSMGKSARKIVPILIGIVVLIVGLAQVRHHTVRDDHGLGEVLMVTVISASAAAAIALALVGQLGFLSSRVLRFFGRYSYAIYLIHSPAYLIVQRFYGLGQFRSIHGSQLGSQLLFYTFCLSLTLALALLSWNLWEKHFLKLKGAFPERVVPKSQIRPIAIPEVAEVA